MTTMTPVCAYCRHFHRAIRDREECDAFPDGIPAVITSGRNKHQKPVAGDGGIRFEPIPGFEQLKNHTQGGGMIGRPTPAAVKNALRRWASLEKYTAQERALVLLFQTLYPANTTLEHVLLKVSALNDFYSTNILDTYTVATHILNLHIDARLKRGDRSLVNEVARVGTHDFYAFASKYCAHHQPEHFPIYDSYVDKMLRHFNRMSPFTSFRQADLRHYERFVPIVKAFQRHFGLQAFSFREIDNYLWLTGKEHFPRRSPHTEVHV